MAPFRQVGELPLAGNGVANKVLETAISEAELQCMRDDSDSDVLARLREDQHAEQLLQVAHIFQPYFCSCLLCRSRRVGPMLRVDA